MQTRRSERIGENAEDPKAVRLLAGMIGFTLPLAGLPISKWLPGYPDQVTPPRLVTFIALLWLLTRTDSLSLPRHSRRMMFALSAVLAYATLSLVWTPDVGHGLHDLLTVGLALATGITLLGLVKGDCRRLAWFAGGVLIAAAIQVVLASFEIATGIHVPTGFGATAVEEYGLPSIEDLFGRVAWGTMGNPNDLGGFLLIATAVLLSAWAYGLRLRRHQRLVATVVLLTGTLIALMWLADARAYRLGLALLVAIHLIAALPNSSRLDLRGPVVLLASSAFLIFALFSGSALVAGIQDSADSDATRLELIQKGLSTAIATSGVGRGLGAEKAMLDSGEIPTNFHNIVATLMAELGLLIAAVFVAYLIVLVAQWGFSMAPRTSSSGRADLARAGLAVTLLVYGTTSSGVIESPFYWTFFAVTAAVAAVANEAADRGHSVRPRSPAALEASVRSDGRVD